jgi:hypothetical protein
MRMNEILPLPPPALGAECAGGRGAASASASGSSARHAPGRRQRGAVVIICAVPMAVMLVDCGLALDLGQLYNRMAELQGIAGAAAMAAAREPVGTATGVPSAHAKASEAANRFKCQYRLSLTLNELFRVPRVICSDNDAVFTSRMLRLGLHLLGIRHRPSASGCPWRSEPPRRAPVRQYEIETGPVHRSRL